MPVGGGEVREGNGLPSIHFWFGACKSEQMISWGWIMRKEGRKKGWEEMEVCV